MGICFCLWCLNRPLCRQNKLLSWEATLPLYNLFMPAACTQNRTHKIGQTILTISHWQEIIQENIWRGNVHRKTPNKWSLLQIFNEFEFYLWVMIKNILDPDISFHENEYTGTPSVDFKWRAKTQNLKLHSLFWVTYESSYYFEVSLRTCVSFQHLFSILPSSSCKCLSTNVLKNYTHSLKYVPS